MSKTFFIKYPCFILTHDFRTPFLLYSFHFVFFIPYYIYFSFLCYFQLPSLLPCFSADRTTLVAENFQSFLDHKVSETFCHHFLLVGCLICMSETNYDHYEQHAFLLSCFCFLRPACYEAQTLLR